MQTALTAHSSLTLDVVADGSLDHGRRDIAEQHARRADIYPKKRRADLGTSCPLRLCVLYRQKANKGEPPRSVGGYLFLFTRPCLPL